MFVDGNMYILTDGIENLTAMRAAAIPNLLTGKLGEHVRELDSNPRSA